jgi:hypothetical protein
MRSSRRAASPRSIADDRTGASPNDVYWSGDAGQSGHYLHGYTSTWLPAALLDERDARMLVDALFAASGHWTVGLHFNKGLAGAPADVIDEAARTAMNPVAMRSFALAIIAAEGPPGHPDVHGHEPDLVRARSDARRVRDARAVAGRAGPWIVRCGKRLLRNRLGARVLGRALCAAARDQVTLRPATHLQRASRRRQRMILSPDDTTVDRAKRR